MGRVFLFMYFEVGVLLLLIGPLRVVMLLYMPLSALLHVPPL